MVIGTVLSDRYQIEERLAAGGMGSVYVATDQRLGRKVALKILKEDLADDERFVERFRREARAAGALSHPNIAGVFDFGQDRDRYYMVMELVPGKDLARVLREEGPLSAKRSVHIASQVAQALDHAHSAGVVHRDIKPANVIVGDNDRVKVTDFGIARAVGDSTLTATGSVLGTAHYISPEQAGGGEVGPVSDIYSLGIVLYEMLTGSLPFTGDSALAVAMRHVADDVPPPSELNEAVAPALDEVVSRATAKDPLQRFPDAKAMHEALTSTVAPTADVGTTALPEAAAAATGTKELEPSVWPIPGSRYDPQALGRKVLMTLAALALIALFLFALRLGGSEQDASDADTQQQEQVEDQEPQDVPEESILVSEDFIGDDYREVADILTKAGIAVDTEAVPSDEGRRDAVLYTSPPVGSRLQGGDAITLFVSTREDDDEDEGDEHGPPDHSKGKEHKEDKDD